jgi:molecular chaperone DnaJ
MATTERDYYEILGVDRSATDAEIKRAFRLLARELHPDVSDAPDAAERFRELAEAYEVLSNAQTRELYDRHGIAGLRRGGYTPGDFDFGDLSDVFSAFFGESLFGRPTGAARRRARGADLTAVAEVSLAEAFTGTTLRVPVRVATDCDRCGGRGAEPGTEPIVCPVCAGAGRVQHVSQSVFGQFVRSSTCPRCEGRGRVIPTPCARCDGSGRVLAERTLDVEVPPGIHDGQRIRLRGEGHAGLEGGAAGDVFVLVRVRPDEHVERDGDDLVATVELTMVDAALGRAVTVATPEGAIELDLPAGVQPGDVHVVRGRGMPSLGGGRRGDLRVRTAVRIPRKLSDEQRATLERLGTSLGEDAYRDDGFFERLKSAFR